jgi:hypothetical protein
MMPLLRQPPPNNSFNRSGISLPFIRKIEGCSAILPARSSQWFGIFLVSPNGLNF